MGRLTPLLQNLSQSYTLEGLEVLSGTLDIPWDFLSGDTLPKRALSLLKYADKHGKMTDLVAQGRKDFGHLDWQVPPQPQPGDAADIDDDAGVAIHIGDTSGTVNIGNVANVKNNSGNVAVGNRNVIQIGSLNVPRWLVIALPLLLVAGIAVTLAGTARVFTITQPTPTPVVGSQRMTGAFNVAVAQFAGRDAAGKQTIQPLSGELSQWVYASLKEQLKDMDAQVWHDSLPLAEKGRAIGIITGTTPAERWVTAQKLADEINAQIIVYGDLGQTTDSATFAPEIFVASSAFSPTLEAEASEVAGQHRMGTPVEVPLPPSAETRLQVANQLKSRALFVRGLIYDLSGSHDLALEDFQAAKRTWQEEPGKGKEALDFFLGREALFLLRKPDKALAAFGSEANALDAAEAGFRAAIDANPPYPLGNWGLGTVLLKRVEPIVDKGELSAEEYVTVTAALDQALILYDTALNSVDAQAQPALAAKIRLSKANALRLYGLAGLLKPDPAVAEQRLNAALDELDIATPALQTEPARTRANIQWVRGTTRFYQAVLLDDQGKAEASKAALQSAKQDLAACVELGNDPANKFDKTLIDYVSTNCGPNLERVNAALAP